MLRRAFRRVCDAADPKWLEHRAQMICGSEMSIVLGNQPDWMKTTYEDLLAEKRSGVPRTFTPTRRMYWGTLCERSNMQLFAKSVGIQVRPTNALLQSTRNARVGSTLDGICRIPRTRREPDIGFAELCGNQSHVAGFFDDIAEYAGRVGVIELKQTDWLGDWKSGPPLYYLVQVQTQLYVTGLDFGLLVARVGASDMRAFVIEPDPFLFDEMDEAVTQFWKEVSRG